jgi:hypothetical protein
MLVTYIHPNMPENGRMIPKESYLTFESYQKTLTETPEKISLIANANWVALTFSEPLIGKFEVNNDAILSISRFSGDIGSAKANVNRWRNQLGLAPINKTMKALPTMTFGSIKGNVVRLKNDNQHMLVVWITVNNYHFFNKVISRKKINEDEIFSFIESQPWASL